MIQFFVLSRSDFLWINKEIGSTRLFVDSKVFARGIGTGKKESWQ